MGIIGRSDLLTAYYTGNPDEQSKYRYEYSIVEIKKRQLDISPILEKLPADILNFLVIAGEIADKYQVRVYLIGGMVRDIFLGIENRDLDLVLDVEKRDPAIVRKGFLEDYIRELADVFQVNWTYNSKFRTGNFLLPGGLNVDLAEARRDFYRYSTALPEVEPADIIEDLIRRDYTINTLALMLNKAEWGLLLDYFHGLEDLQKGKLRILHPFSFLDDPTRIIRGIRIASKIGFSFEEESSALLEEVLIGADFSRLPLERVLKEFEFLLARPITSALFNLLRKYPLFKLLNLTIEVNDELQLQVEKLESYLAEFREKNYNIEEWALRLALFIADAGEEVLNWQIRSEYKKIFLAFKKYKSLLPELDQDLAADELADMLKILRDEELLILMARSGSRRIEENILRYMKVLKDIELKINGNDLIASGLQPGPVIREILDKVYRKRLKGSLYTREEQLAYVRGLIREVEGNKE